jgi:chromosome segregation ATPase
MGSPSGSPMGEVSRLAALPGESSAADPGREIGRLRRENAALRAEIRRLESAVEASNGELHRLLGADPALVRAETERMLRDWGAAETRLRSTLAQLEAAQRQLAAGGADFGR